MPQAKTHTHTHLIRCDSQSLSTEKSPYSTGLWVKVNNVTKADRFSSLQRDGDGDGKKEKVIITAKEGFWEQKKKKNTIQICQKDHMGVNSICPELNVFIKLLTSNRQHIGQVK